MHRNILTHYPISQLPIYFCGAAAIAAIGSCIQTSVVRWISLFVLMAGVPIGVIGVNQHTEGEFDKLLPFFTFQTMTSQAQERGEEPEEHEQGRAEKREGMGGPPLLAPLGICGLSLIGVISGWPTKGERRSR